MTFELIAVPPIDPSFLKGADSCDVYENGLGRTFRS